MEILFYGHLGISLIFKRFCFWFLRQALLCLSPVAWYLWCRPGWPNCTEIFLLSSKVCWKCMFITVVGVFRCRHRMSRVPVLKDGWAGDHEISSSGRLSRERLQTEYSWLVFPTCMLRPFNIVPHVMIPNQNKKSFSLLLHNYNFATVYELQCKRFLRQRFARGVVTHSWQLLF